MRGKTLEDFHGVVFDMCALTVMLLKPGMSKSAFRQYFDDFKELLRAEHIHYRSPHPDHPLVDAMVRMVDAEDMHRLMCKLPGRLTNMVRD